MATQVRTRATYTVEVPEDLHRKKMLGALKTALLYQYHKDVVKCSGCGIVIMTLSRCDIIIYHPGTLKTLQKLHFSTMAAQWTTWV